MTSQILIDAIDMRKISWVVVDQTKRLNARLQRAKDRLLMIPAVQLISRTAKESANHDATHIAAGVAFYSILSIFPLLLGLLALFGFFLPLTNLQDELLKFVDSNIPGATDILGQNIEGIIRLRSILGVLSIVGLFWSASEMFGAISLAINRAWGIRRGRPFLISKARELGMAFGTGILFLLSMGANAIISILPRILDLPAADLLIINVGSRLAAFLLVLAVFLFLYKLIPNTKTYWRYIWPGALLAAVLFEIARTLFILCIFILYDFARYQLIYGSIAPIVVLLVWIYYSAFIVILGAEFTFQYGRMRYSVTTGSGADK